MREVAAASPSGKRRAVHLRFLVSPVAILGDDRVEAVEIVRNRLEADSAGRIRAVPTAEREIVECGIALRSVGYRGVGLPGVPFDEQRGVIANEAGRARGEDGEPLCGVYCAGWIKRGPSGVIGTNKKDATETVDLLLADAAAGKLSHADPRDVADLLAERGVAVVGYSGWEAIDAAERARGEAEGRPRVKLCSWDELLETASASDR
jgi:ferredoxin--NADP+ reductase